jgi:hypothetical protein
VKLPAARAEMCTANGKTTQVIKIFIEMKMRVADFLVALLRPVCYFSFVLNKLQTMQEKERIFLHSMANTLITE